MFILEWEKNALEQVTFFLYQVILEHVNINLSSLFLDSMFLQEDGVSPVPN